MEEFFSHITAPSVDQNQKEPTRNALPDRIENEPNPIPDPDRTATLRRNSFELSQLDGEGMREMEQQQAQQMAEVAKESAIRNLAKNSDMNHADLSEKAKAATRSVGRQTLFRNTHAQPSARRSIIAWDDFRLIFL